MSGATWLLACAIAVPASAGENDRAVPLFSDGRGNKAWVQVETAGGRTKATPFIAVGGDGAQKGAQKLEAGEKAAIPLPAIMRFVEHAREALRDGSRRSPQAPPSAAAPQAPRPTAGSPRAEAAGTSAGDPLESAPTRCAECDLHGGTLDPGTGPAPAPDAAATRPATAPARAPGAMAPHPVSWLGPTEGTGGAIYPPVAMFSTAGP